MIPLERFVVFSLERARYALPLAWVERVIRAVEITPLPGAPAPVAGVIDVAGTAVAVYNLRRRFRLPDRAVEPTDHYLLARSGSRPVALIVDEAQAVIAAARGDFSADPESPTGADGFEGVIRHPDGLFLIHNLPRFLSPDETEILDAAFRLKAGHDR